MTDYGVSSDVALFERLQDRFEMHPHRHEHINWDDFLIELKKHPEIIKAIHWMEATGGEPDVIELHKDKYLVADMAAESPKGRRSLCYDFEAWSKRKANKPQGNTVTMAFEQGVQLMDEALYRELQAIEPFDLKSSSWLLTPSSVREHGGAIFGDCRYTRVFIYHNGADSYYAARGFRTFVTIPQ